MEENSEQIKALGILKVFVDPESSGKIVEESFKDWKVNLYNRIIYKGNTDTVFMDYTNNMDVSSIISSNSLQNGFGVCNVEGNCIRGWCLSEYNSPGKCGVGIGTVGSGT